jgi:hypothetical protein
VTKIYFINLYSSYGLEIYLTILVLHMANSTKATKISSIFLAAILIAGTITAVYPSFVIGAEAQPETYYGVDSYKQSYGKESYKSKDSSSSIVKKVKCNNIDVNVNGLELKGLPPSLSGLLASEAEAADEGHYGASSYGSGEGSYGSDGQSGSDKDFKFVCINNNNNTVIGEEEEPIPEPDLACEECFAANIALQSAIVDALVLNEGTTAFTVFDSILVIGPGTDTIEQLCNIIESSADLFGVPVTDLLLDYVFSSFLGVDFEAPNSGIDALIECLLEAGIIVHEEEELPPPPSDSLSANGIAGANVQCTGPLCEGMRL